MTYLRGIVSDRPDSVLTAGSAADQDRFLFPFSPQASRLPECLILFSVSVLICSFFPTSFTMDGSSHEGTVASMEHKNDRSVLHLEIERVRQF